MRSLSRCRGATIVYLTVLMTALMAFSSLAVDYGHVQFTKTQLQHGAETAARYGAQGLPNIIYGASAAYSNAVAAAADCSVDGAPLVLDSNNDVQIGVWNTSSRTFTANTDPTACNAVKVTAHHSAARGTAVSLWFARVLGQRSCDVNASAIAMLTQGASANYTVQATCSPFLAGAADGTMSSPNNPHNNPDYAPHDNPIAVTGVSVTPGASLTLDGINGGATNDFHDASRYTADGNLSAIVNNTAGSEHGLANITAPINCLVGVFLTNSLPDNTAAPASLDFSTDASRDFTSLSPQLQQIFFIGDGRTSAGQTQTFVVPKNATRFYLGTWDSYEWNNNIGSFSATIHQTGTVTLVQ